MAEHEPRAVPLDIVDLHTSWWYCLDCGSKFAMEEGAKGHYKREHGEADDIPIRGVDYARGDQLLNMQRRRLEWIEDQAQRFVHEMHAGFGAEDFAAECEIRGGPLSDA